MDTIYKGRRSGGFLFVRNNPNITILAEVHSKKLVIDEANRECKGVTVIPSSATELSFYIALEVILSQGVFESSKLLMASGIGPKGRQLFRGGCAIQTARNRERWKGSLVP
ncbi:hypothetical protein CEP52_009142 [Fusarium oligoseptatum]|uniref:Glucose-methanol-choline oxidoreductase N-terminal domain-containing protein n=1 Tax=Fusarium oligoseptatum TaxID=2604345 RepID=A0A428TEH0_9HYPO|nr:hypothetical protein CEP52_009142 [Fusarium oligoseptatum]